MVVLGLDPGSRKLGYGVLQLTGGRPLHLHSGVLKLRAADPISHRLKCISEFLQKIGEEFSPEVMVLEKAFLGKNPQSAFQLGHVRGVCLLQSAMIGADVVEMAARKAKKVVTGHGGASKDHVRLIVRQELQIPKLESEDQADALGLALAFWHQAIENSKVIQNQNSMMPEGTL